MSAKGLSTSPTKEALPDWNNLLSNVLNSWKRDGSGVVISADVDGLMSTALLALKYPVNVIGIYTTTHLILLDNASRHDAAKALWLDHDVSEIGVRCVGQHLVQLHPGDVMPLRETTSFNPNVWANQSWVDSFRGRRGKKRDKYPYGTCHFIANHLGVDPGSSISTLSALLAHADGTWRTVVDYQHNAQSWYDLMFEGDVFLRFLREEWHSDPRALRVHKKTIDELLALGIAPQTSRAKIAQLLPEDLKALTGRQSVRYLPTNQTAYVQKIRQVLDFCARSVGSRPTIGETPTVTISGVVDTPYPNKIENFDEFMVENDIFSHAFTELRALKFTSGIRLVDPTP
jgi:hypothetical protein